MKHYFAIATLLFCCCATAAPAKDTPAGEPLAPFDIEREIRISRAA